MSIRMCDSCNRYFNDNDSGSICGKGCGEWFCEECWSDIPRSDPHALKNVDICPGCGFNYTVWVDLQK